MEDQARPPFLSAVSIALLRVCLFVLMKVLPSTPCQISRMKSLFISAVTSSGIGSTTWMYASLCLRSCSTT
ncbi:hypothetical protein BDR07DRAFT_137696 [Suillus spraguei]|nr:hypothetical protein BDR07DRAFT_137696 [Suillus spraguei]